jgi:hypothetical protein
MSALAPKFLPLLKGRRIASLGTRNDDGSPHLTAAWYLYRDGCFWWDMPELAAMYFGGRFGSTPGYLLTQEF